MLILKRKRVHGVRSHIHYYWVECVRSLVHLLIFLLPIRGSGVCVGVFWLWRTGARGLEEVRTCSDLLMQ